MTFTLYFALPRSFPTLTTPTNLERETLTASYLTERIPSPSIHPVSFKKGCGKLTEAHRHKCKQTAIWRRTDRRDSAAAPPSDRSRSVWNRCLASAASSRTPMSDGREGGGRKERGWGDGRGWKGEVDLRFFSRSLALSFSFF